MRRPPLPLLLLILAAVLSRWLTRTELVQAWDAGNFVLALDHLDLAAQQPHLPGCFWNLIVLGRALRPLTGGNGVAALELLNALAAGGAVACAWLLGRQMATPRTGWWAAVLVLTAPLLWFYGSQPLSYGVELGWVLAIALCGWLVAAGRASALVPLALLMATAGGIRPNTPVFLLPLALACCWRGRRLGIAPWRIGLALLLGAGVLVAWFHAFLVEAGGVPLVLRLLLQWQGGHARQSLEGGVLSNGWLLIKTTALTAPLALALLLALARRGDTLAASAWRRLFLLLWIIPGSLYFLLVHFTRMGHATTILPGLVMAMALPLAGRSRWPRDLLLVGLLQALLFLLVPGDRFASQLRSYDREWGAAITEARRFDAATTLVVASGSREDRAHRLPSVHLPAYDHDQSDYRLDEVQERVPAQPPLQRVLLFDRGLAVPAPQVAGTVSRSLIPGRLRVHEIPVPPGGLQVGWRAVEPAAMPRVTPEVTP